MGGNGKEQVFNCDIRNIALVPLCLFLFHFLTNSFSSVYEQICIFAVAVTVR